MLLTQVRFCSNGCWLYLPLRSHHAAAGATNLVKLRVGRHAWQQGEVQRGAVAHIEALEAVRAAQQLTHRLGC